MRNETFYSTVAQVIPALLIALAVEFVGIRQHLHNAGHKPDPDEYRSGDPENPTIDWLVVLTALLGLVVFIAEACALLVLITGTNTWFPLVAGPFCVFAVLVMTLFVAWGYWLRLIQMNAF